MARTKRNARRGNEETTESGGGLKLTGNEESLLNQYLRNVDPMVSDTASNTLGTSECSMLTHSGDTDTDSVSTLSGETFNDLWNFEPAPILCDQTPPVSIDLTGDECSAEPAPIAVDIALPSEDAPSGSTDTSAAPTSATPELNPIPHFVSKKKPSTPRRRKAPAADGEGSECKKPRGRSVAKQERAVSPVTPMLSLKDAWPKNFNAQSQPTPAKRYLLEGVARPSFFEIFIHPTETQGVSKKKF